MVKGECARFANAYLSAGRPEMSASLITIELGSNVPKAEAAYVMRRLTEYSATSFHREICKQAKTPGFLDWVHAQMNKFPMDVTKRYHD